MKLILTPPNHHYDRNSPPTHHLRQATLEVMKTHPKNAAILKHACRALANLAFNEETQYEIAEAGGIMV